MRLFLCIGDFKTDGAALDSGGSLNRLFAFHNFWGWKLEGEKLDEALRRIKIAKGSAEVLMMDSGAAWVNDVYFGKRKDFAGGVPIFNISEFDEKVENYCRLLREGRNNGLIDVAVELDLDHIVGMAKVKEWRKKLLKTGVEIIPVWRPTQGRDEWNEVNKKFKWIAISEGFLGSAMSKETFRTFIKKLVYAGYRNGNRYHLFAGIKKDVVFDIPLYSTDSSTWSSYGRWGATYAYSKTDFWIYAKRGKFGLDSFNKQEFIGMADNVFNPHDPAYAAAVSARAYVEAEKFVTGFWNRKGIIYED